jgi:tetratricopeptide (TPR) repeat protein
VSETPFVLLLIASLFFSTGVQAQQAAPISPKKAEAEQSLPAAQPAAANAPYVIELIQNKLTFEADGKGARDTVVRVRINAESAVRDFGVLVYPFASSFDTLDIRYVRVRKPDGTVVETPASDIQELDSAVSREAPMYTDQREKHIAVKSLSVGDLLEVNLRWTVHDPPAPGHFWFDHSFFDAGVCQKEVLELDLPREVKVSIKNGKIQPVIREDGLRRIYTYETSNLKEPETSKIPAWEKNYHGLQPPDVQLSSFTSWTEVGEWFNAQIQPKIKLTPEIQARADELTKGKVSEEEKIRALYDFVSTRFRYIGIDLGVGRYSPHTASDVLSNRYGDCKDKHALLAALLEASGIHSSPVLISTKFRIDSNFPSPSLFDHVITAIPQGKSYLFLDTTSELAPFGYLVPVLRDRQGLASLANGKSMLVTTPTAEPIPDYEKIEVTGSIDAKGTMDAKMRFEDRGDGELNLRLAFRATPGNRWNELTQALMQRMGFGGTVTDVTAASPEDTGNPFWIAFSYHRPDYSDWKNRRITLPLPPLILPELNEEQLRSKDELPLGALKEIDYKCSLKLPAGYTADVPEQASRKTPFLEFMSSDTIRNNELKGERRLKILESEIAAAMRPAYNTLVKSIDDAENRYIFVHGGPLSAVDLHYSPQDGIGALISKLEEAHKADPEDAETLVQLGRAYCNAGRPADAVEMLEEASGSMKTVPPEISVALGLAYLRLQNIDKATAEIHKGVVEETEAETLLEVAGALARSDVDMEDAARYAARAAAKLSARTMAIDVHDIKPEDFGMMPELAHAWDTIGWIKFRLHDTVASEQYLVAAWELLQSAPVGEHLVEVYEAEGKKAKAAAICNMANAAPIFFDGDGVKKKLSDEMERLRPFLKGQADGNMAMSDMRTLSVPFHTKLSKNFVTSHLVVSMTNEPQVRVRFADGENELAPASGALSALKYPQAFPDAAQTRVVRVGVLSCSVYSKDCTLVFMPIMDSAVLLRGLPQVPQ